MSSSVADTVLPPSTTDPAADSVGDQASSPAAPVTPSSAQANPDTTPSTGAADASAALATAPVAASSASNVTEGIKTVGAEDFKHHLMASGNILGGVPTAKDTNPSAVLFTAYLVFIVVLGLRSLFRRTRSSVDFRVFCFHVLRVATFGMRFGLSEDHWAEPEHGALIGEGVLLLIGPLLLISALMTVIVNIATPTLDALKARADAERTAEGGSRRPGGGAQFFLKHLPMLFQLIIGICAVLTLLVAFRFHKALQGNAQAQREVRQIKAVTTFSLMAITLLTLVIIIVLCSKLAAAGRSERFLGLSRRSKGFKMQTFLATVIGLCLAVVCMYRMIQAHVPLDNHVNKYTLFWGVYVGPETFAALLYTLYCFPQLPADEIVVVPQMPGGDSFHGGISGGAHYQPPRQQSTGGDGNDSDSESIQKPAMRSLGRNGSIASVARSTSSSGSARYVVKP